MRIPRALTLAPGWALTQAWIWRGGRSFIVMHTGRVGSVVLGHMLGEHPQVLFDYDPLHRRRADWVRAHGPDQLWREDPRWELMRRPWRARRRVYGVVVKPGNFDSSPLAWENALAFLARSLRPKRLAMTRRNLLRQIISGCRALEVDQWHVPAGATPSGQTLQAHPDRLPRYFGGTYTLAEALAEREAMTAKAAAAAAEVKAEGLHLVYEEHLEADPYLGYTLACQLIGVTPDPAARPKLVKTGNRPVSELVSRPEDWRAALRGTPWEWMFDA